MYTAWHDEDYGYMITSINLQPFGVVFAEARGWLDPERPPVVRFYHELKNRPPYYEMPTFTLDATDPQPLCNTESMSASEIDRFKQWIVENYICLWRHWTGAIDSVDLCRGLFPSEFVKNATGTPESIRSLLKVVEKRIKSIVGSNPRDFYNYKYSKDDCRRISRLLETRASCLNKLFRCTPADVKRIEVINDKLTRLYNSLMHEAANLCRATIANVDSQLDDNYDFKAIISTEVFYSNLNDSIPTGVIQLEDDDYYGSDFRYMAYVVQENVEILNGNCPGVFHKCSSVGKDWINERAKDALSLSDEEVGFDNLHDDGHSWIFPFKYPELDHIPICYVIHSMLAYKDGWSWPDLVRINSYIAETKVGSMKEIEVFD